ncbi:MAG TPA: chemotaxis protein CheV, partial [bacterium]|nr:chemotaxis protein CheV [bacterium]
GATPLMMARAGAQIFGLPVAAVEHVVAVEKAHLEPGQHMRMDFRGQWLDVADLGALLGLRPPLPAESGQALLVLQSNGRRVALLVDAVEGDAELVVLPLPYELELGARHPYAGASLYLGSELVLVLKSEWILAHAAAGEGPSPSQRRALVVDDSLTARAMHRAALEAGGFSVLAAPGGAQALALLARTRVDVVVSDIQMDGMDGFELCRRLRATSAGAKLPVVLVSVSDSDAERETGRLAGASAFLNKRDCAAGRLVQLVQGLLGGA